MLNKLKLLFRKIFHRERHACKDCYYFYNNDCNNNVCFKVTGFDYIEGDILERVKSCYDLNHNGTCLYYENRYY